MVSSTGWPHYVFVVNNCWHATNKTSENCICKLHLGLNISPKLNKMLREYLVKLFSLHWRLHGDYTDVCGAITKLSTLEVMSVVGVNQNKVTVEPNAFQSLTFVASSLEAGLRVPRNLFPPVIFAFHANVQLVRNPYCCVPRKRPVSAKPLSSQYAIFRDSLITLVDFVRLVSTTINHKHIVWSTCGQQGISLPL